MNQPAQKNRREMLEAIVAEKPHDAFARYGLALECANAGDTTAAIGHFEKLLAAHAGYVAGYQQYGQLLARLARRDQARRILAAGIEAARRAGQAHAADEMEEALRNLEVLGSGC